MMPPWLEAVIGFAAVVAIYALGHADGAARAWRKATPPIERAEAEAARWHAEAARWRDEAERLRHEHEVAP